MFFRDWDMAVWVARWPGSYGCLRTGLASCAHLLFICMRFQSQPQWLWSGLCECLWLVTSWCSPWWPFWEPWLLPYVFLIFSSLVLSPFSFSPHLYYLTVFLLFSPYPCLSSLSRRNCWRQHSWPRRKTNSCHFWDRTSCRLASDSQSSWG